MSVRSLLFAWHFRHHRYVEAVAALGELPAAMTSKQLWACYRLGMHETVAGTGRADDDWRGAYAKAVSLAACGRKGEAEAAACEVQACQACAAKLPALAGAIAGFMPEVSLQLIEGVQAPPSLRVALLLRTGRLQEARDVLHDALAAGQEQAHPELLLHHSNATPHSLDGRLARLNAYFGAFGLSPVALIDEANPPAPGNLRASGRDGPVFGPLVTVLMTSYQAGDRIGAAVDSVLAQSYRSLELIVVDDGSTDGTSGVVDLRLRRDPRVKYVRLDRNGGAYAARNVGLAMARGVFVTCHDADDWSHPVKLERQIAPLRADARLVCTTSNWVRMRDDGTYYARPVHPLCRMNPSSPLFRREPVVARAGVWDPVRTGGDMEYFNRMKVVFGAEAVRKVAEPLALGSHRPGSLMTDDETGYSEGGTSPERLAYWEAWMRWHVGQVRKRRLPRVVAP